jgi:hypothetical protein
MEESILEKLIDFHLLKGFPSFRGTSGFITVFITARHSSLSDLE